MAHVKVFLQKGDTIEEVQDALFKALGARPEAKLLAKTFKDPAMQDILTKMIAIHEDIYTEMLSEIYMVLTEEYRDSK